MFCGMKNMKLTKLHNELLKRKKNEHFLSSFHTQRIATNKAHNLNVHRKLKTKRWTRNVLSAFNRENMDRIFRGNGIFLLTHIRSTYACDGGKCWGKNKNDE